MLNTSPEATDDFSYPLDLVKLVLQLIDLLENAPEPRYLVIRHLNRIARAVVLRACRSLRRFIKL